MNSSTHTPFPEETQVRALYQQLLESWNNRNAEGMAEPFLEDGEIIGFDGSHYTGREEIVSNLKQIFADHPTGVFVGKVKGVRLLGPDVALLRAIAGMIPHGQSDLNPNLNTHHSLVAVKHEGKWRIALFQNTPAQFHGRPELVQQMTEELRKLLT